MKQAHSNCEVGIIFVLCIEVIFLAIPCSDCTTNLRALEVEVGLGWDGMGVGSGRDV
jgi:hypothetical protein